MEPDLTAQVGSSDVAHEDQRISTTGDNTKNGGGRGELLIEESSCKTIQVSKKVSSKKAKAAQSQLFKGKEHLFKKCGF